MVCTVPAGHHPPRHSHHTGHHCCHQVSLDAEDIRNEKVKVLRSMKVVPLEDVVIGQYRARTAGGTKLPGYLDDPTVPKGSLTPTFATVAMFINNARWDGVPFLLKAGKALHKRCAEIRVQFG